MALPTTAASNQVDKWVAELQVAIVEGVGREGAPGPSVLESLYNTDALAQYLGVQEDGSKSLKLYGSAQARIGKDILEHGVRQACASLLRQGLERGVNPMLLRHGQAAEPGLQRLMDFTVFAAASDHDSFDPLLTYTLMEDIVEVCTIEDAEHIFYYLETRIEALRSLYANFEKSPAKMAALRILNQLSRRLSRASSSELCGRITMFLSHCIPLLDRSGLNVQGAFNDAHSTPVEEVPEGATDSSGHPIDREFYRTFWGLQAVFQKPYSIIEPSAWAAATSSIHRVLAEFRKQPVNLASSSGSSDEAGSMAEEVQLTVKYLSSPKLLRLQLQDAALRRHFLVQALITLHACQHPVIKAGGAAKRDALRSKQVVEAEELEKQLYAELEGLPKTGKQFVAAIRCILKRETRWAAWKAEGCNSYERRSPVELQPLPPRKLAPRKARPHGRVDVGVPAINRLRNACKDNLSCLTGKANKRHVPTFREFMQPVITEMDPEECVEDQYKTKKDPVYAWKALRLAARESLLGVAQAIEPLTKAKKRRATIDLEDIVHKLLPEAVPEAVRKKVEPVPAQAPAPASGAVSQDASIATGAASVAAAADGAQPEVASPRTAAVRDSSAAEGDAAAASAMAEALPTPQPALLAGQAAEPMQVDTPASGEAAEQGSAATAAAEETAEQAAKDQPQGGDPAAGNKRSAESKALQVADVSAPSKMGLTLDKQLLGARSRSDPLDSSKGGALVGKEAPSVSAPIGDSTGLLEEGASLQEAEQANGQPLPEPKVQEALQPEIKPSNAVAAGAAPLHNGVLKEAEAAAPAKQPRPAAKRTRRT